MASQAKLSIKCSSRYTSDSRTSRKMLLNASRLFMATRKAHRTKRAVVRLMPI